MRGSIAAQTHEEHVIVCMQIQCFFPCDYTLGRGLCIIGIHGCVLWLSRLC